MSSNTNANAGEEMAYHYAGKVHVRGLLRRVWRPRYLALGDDGYLRYHESLPLIYRQDRPYPNQLHNPNPNSLSLTSASHGNMHPHTHRPKSVLKILDGARTIDPHSVVDQHVALPEGVFGFVFRGRTVELHPNDSIATVSTEGDSTLATGSQPAVDHCAVFVPHHGSGHDGGSTVTKHISASKQMVNLVFPKGTARRGIAQKLAKQAINPDVLCGFGRTNNCDGGISRSSSSSSLVDQIIDNDDLHGCDVNNNNEWGRDSYETHDSIGSFQEIESRRDLRRVSADIIATSIPFQVQAASIQSREYLCAVSTAEEAESWVVALRWAAEHRRRRKYGSYVRISETESNIKHSRDHDGATDIICRDDVNTTTPNREEHDEKELVGHQAKETASAISATFECIPEEDNPKQSIASMQESVSDAKISPQISPLISHEPKSTTSATIIVTKVSSLCLPLNSLVNFGFKKQDGFLPFIYFPLPGDDLLLQYEIQLLLLRNCKSSINTALHPESVEERTISKSIHDVLAFIRDLMSDFSSSKCHIPSIPNETIVLLEDIQCELLACLESYNNNLTDPCRKENGLSGILGCTIDELSCSCTKILASVERMDRVMRKISKDSNICSSNRFQEFLCLQSAKCKSSLSDTSPKRKATQFIVSEESDAEQIVRSWLSNTMCLSTRTKLGVAIAVTLRHRAAGPLFSLIFIWSVLRLASIFWSLIYGTGLVVTIPLETYAIVVASAFYLGHLQGVSSQHGSKVHIDAVGLKSQRVDLANEVLMGASDDHSTVAEKEDNDSDDDIFAAEQFGLSSPLPLYPSNNGISCWSKPDHKIFMVRSTSYFEDRFKAPSAPEVFECRGVDVWITDNAERNIARHPCVLGGKLDQENTFVVNFLLPFSNFVAYFTIPPIEKMPVNVAQLWTEFIRGDQQFRDSKLKLLPVVVEGPWIVKKAVGPGTSPAMVGRDLPLQYYFTDPTTSRKGVYEVDVLVTASRIARGILNVVKGHTKSLTMAFAFILEASKEAQLPEIVLCSFQVHSLHLEECPNLPDCYPDG